MKERKDGNEHGKSKGKGKRPPSGKQPSSGKRPPAGKRPSSGKRASPPKRPPLSKRLPPRLPSQVTLARASGVLAAGALAIVILMVVPPGGRAPAPVRAPPAEPALPTIARPWAAEQQSAAASRPAPQPPQAGRPIPLAIVLDDAGHNLADAEAYLRFPGKLSVAVLPQLVFSAEVAARAAQAGKEVILHLPMEPQGPSDPGPGAIKVGYDGPAVIGLLERHFGSLGTRGVNNHMGSRATADPRIMDTVMAYLKRTDRFFLDSRTTADSVARESAARHGVPFLSRDVFLDVSTDEATVSSAIDRGMAIAREQGRAILIGHVTNRVVLSVLESRLPEIERAGFELVYLSEMLPR